MAGAGPTEHRPVADERFGAGKELRRQVPRTAHATWTPPADRPDPVAVLEEQGRTRLQSLLPVRYGRMLESAFAYYRGAAAMMAHDLAATPDTGLVVQACGDAHLSNFGTFATPERNLVFDLNDFDETLAGPWEWDLKRLTASAVVAARSIGLGDAAGRDAALSAVRSYRHAMAALARMPLMDRWYFRVDADAVAALLDTAATKRGEAADRKRIDKAVQKARRNTSARALPKLTELTEEGTRRITDHPPLVAHRDEVDQDVVERFLEAYRATLTDERRVLLDHFRLEDVALKVVGVGSVGTRCFIVLLSSADGDPLFLQVKEADTSVLAPHSPTAPAWDNEGHRVVAGQKIMQAASDLFLGWASGPEHDFYVRQLRDMKGSAEISTFGASILADYLALCGAVLARAHARSADPAVIAGYVGEAEAVDTFDRAVADFAAAYADQNDRDYEALQAAVSSGRLEAETGV
ncbi:MAG: DUF2252 domain-containing protein [Acidimicrobiales bacterium]|nr:DUF2252 domain-containing protein [Acidimicrobiales bacterium]